MTSTITKENVQTLDLSMYYPPETAKRKWSPHRQIGCHKLRKLEALVAADYKCVRCGRADELVIHRLTNIKGARDEREVRCVDCHLAGSGVSP